MVNKKSIKSHFSNKAKNYHQKSLVFPWSLIRKNESKIVLNFLGNVRKKNILDVGSGSGYYSRLLAKKKAKKVYALDSSIVMLNSINEKNIIKINQSAESFNIQKKFDIIVTGDDTKRGKPSSEPYIYAANKLKVNYSECLVFENAPLGIKSAKKAKMNCIAIASTVKKHHLKEADIIINKFSDILNLSFVLK